MSIKIQKSGNTEIDLYISDNILQLEGSLPNTEVMVPIYILKRGGVGPITIWWNTVMDAYWDTPMDAYWDTPMDSVV